MQSQNKPKPQIRKILLIVGATAFSFGIIYFIVSAFIKPEIKDQTSDVVNILPDNTRSLVKGNFVIKTPSNNYIIDAPRMLQFSQKEIEEKLGKSVKTQIVDGKEERLYIVKPQSSQELFEVTFSYFNGNPIYCRIILPYHETDEENAFNTLGIDSRYISPAKDTSQFYLNGKTYWYRGEFENRLYDLITISRSVEDVGASGYIANILVEIYLPEEIVFEAKRIIGKAKTNVSGKPDAERVKNKLRTISKENMEYVRAQQLIEEINEILPKLTF